MLFKLPIYILFIISILSCGKSPFINEFDPQANTASLDVYSENIDLDMSTSSRSGQGTAIESVRLHIKGSWLSGPVKNQKNKMLITIYDQQFNRPSIPHILKAYLWMPEMGHGSTPIQINKIADGLYELSNIEFIMGGLWDLHFEFVDDNNTVVQEVVWDIYL